MSWVRCVFGNVCRIIIALRKFTTCTFHFLNCVNTRGGQYFEWRFFLNVNFLVKKDAQIFAPLIFPFIVKPFHFLLWPFLSIHCIHCRAIGIIIKTKPCCVSADDRGVCDMWSRICITVDTPRCSRIIDNNDQDNYEDKSNRKGKLERMKPRCELACCSL